MVRFGILGPIELSDGQQRLSVGGPRQLRLLALLLLHANRAVSSEHLIDALWSDQGPAGATKRLQVAISRLRRTLAGLAAAGPPSLRTTPGGYLLAVAPGELDADVFRVRSEDGRRALEEGDPTCAAQVLREALGLWRGPALAEVAYEEFAQAEIRRLEELRFAVLEARVDADLRLGRHGQLIGELQQLVIEHRWRERLHGQLMLALYRAGRQAEALEVYRRAHTVLVNELGIEPGRALRELEHAILAHDPALAGSDDVATPGVEWRSALPVPPNRLIGRADELGALGDRLRAGSVRLLTLTGPGGVGKTRLALEVARAVEADFSDGAQFVSLAALQRSEDVPAETAKACEIVVVAGESAGQAVTRVLARKHLLLIVDNCEHVLDASPFIAQLLARCPAVTVLATGREPLSLHAEECYPVSPLGLPEFPVRMGTGALATVGAVALFCERAQAHDPGFELTEANADAVAEICRRVDGLPLAIELAAARCVVLSPAEIAERLRATLGALGTGPRDAPSRQHTLSATIDWSHNLLNDVDKRCFARFAVFVGGATIDAAETVTGGGLDTLDRLVAKSLLVRTRPTPSRTRTLMLETIRAYASERLAADAHQNTVHECHYRYYLALAQRHGSEQLLCSRNRAQHLLHLDADIDNLHAALAWAVGQSRADEALALVRALSTYWLMQHRLTDARNWIERALSLPGADAHTKLRVDALLARSWCLWLLGGADAHAAAATVIEAEAIAHELDDPLILSRVLRVRAHYQSATGHLDAAERLADGAVDCARAADDEWEFAHASAAKARAASTAAERRTRVDTAAALLNEVGNIFELANLFSSAAYRALVAGCEHDARHFAERAMPFARELDNPLLWTNLWGNLGLACLLTGDNRAARDAFREELKISRQLVAQPLAAEALLGLAAIEADHGDAVRAAQLVGAATAHRDLVSEDTVADRISAGRFEHACIQCSADTWDAAVREGATLSIEEAIAYALEEPVAAD